MKSKDRSLPGIVITESEIREQAREAAEAGHTIFFYAAQLAGTAKRPSQPRPTKLAAPDDLPRSRTRRDRRPAREADRRSGLGA